MEESDTNMRFEEKFRDLISGKRDDNSFCLSVDNYQDRIIKIEKDQE